MQQEFIAEKRLIMKRLTAAVAATALVLAACGTSDAAGDGTGPIRIGLSTPLSGSAASLGESERKGVELAVAEVNDSGGAVSGRKLELMAQDNACNPTDGASSVSKLITQDKVSALIAALCSGVTLAAMPIAQRNKVPMVVATSTSPDITTASGAGGNKFVFRINPSDANLADALASHLAKGKARKIAILAEDSTYGRTGAEALKKALTKNGLSVTVTDYAAQGTSDFATLISKYRNNGTEAVALYISGADHVGFLRQAAAAKLGLPLTGRVELEGDNLTILGDRQFTGSTSVYPYSSIVGTAENAAFVKSFQAKYGAPPTYEAFEGYNAVKTLADAIKRAGSGDAEAIQQALQKTDLKSLTGGRIAFDANNQAHDKAFILEVRDGRPVVVADVTT